MMLIELTLEQQARQAAAARAKAAEEEQLAAAMRQSHIDEEVCDSLWYLHAH